MAGIEVLTDENVLKVLTDEPQPTQEIAKNVYSDILHKRGASRTTLIRKLEKLEKTGKVEKILMTPTGTGSNTGYITHWKLKEDKNIIKE